MKTDEPNLLNDQMTNRCEVCGGNPPPGHRICDDCWPDAAIEAGHAATCAQCGKPRLIEKLAKAPDGSLVCLSHLE